MSENSGVKMKILLVHNSYQASGFGGEDLVALQEKERLDKTDTVLTYRRYNDEIRSFGVVQKVRFFINTIYSFRTSRDIKAIVRDFRPDFSYVHNIYPLISPSVYHALHSCNVPIVQVMHDHRPLCANSLFFTDQRICEACRQGNTLHAIRKKCFRQSYLLTGLYAATMSYCRQSAFHKIDAYLCPTQFVRSILREANIPDEKLFVRPHAIDVSQVCPAIGTGNYVGFIGRLSSEKGLWTLVRAFERLKVPLKIAGIGPLECELRRYIHEKDIRNIQFTGFISGEAKWEFLRNSRFVVVPSECYETFGMVVVEAYAAGKPVVASNLGGLPALVESGKSGLLFNPASSTDLARQSEFLWSAPTVCAQMGQYARTAVETKFSPDAAYKQLIDIAKYVCRKHRYIPESGYCKAPISN